MRTVASGERAELNGGKPSRHLVFNGIHSEYSIKMLSTLNETIFHVVSITTVKQKMHKEDSLSSTEIYSFSHKAKLMTTIFSCSTLGMRYD